jgi:hypothetical protein
MSCGGVRSISGDPPPPPGIETTSAMLTADHSRSGACAPQQL